MAISVICHNPKCGTKFPAQRRSAKYCSDRCRDVMAAIRKKGTDAPRPKNAICKHCGRVFSISSKGRKPVFCSDSHRVIWHNGIRAAAVYHLSHTRPGEFQCMKPDAAMDVVYGMKNEELIAMFKGLGYRYDGRQFVKIDENPELL